MTREPSIALATCARSYARTWCWSSCSTETRPSRLDARASVAVAASTTAAALATAAAAAGSWSGMRRSRPTRSRRVRSQVVVGVLGGGACVGGGGGGAAVVGGGAAVAGGAASVGGGGVGGLGEVTGGDVTRGAVAGGVVAIVPPCRPLLPGATSVLPSVWMVALITPGTACAVILHCASTSEYTARARYFPPSVV